jgi:hypothetical protein
VSARSGRAAALVLAVLLAAAFAVAVLRRPAQAPVRLDGRPLSVVKTLSPRDPQFGDTVTATVDVSVDSSRVDAGSVRVHGSFAPYRVASSRRTVRRTGNVSLVRVEYRLRCLDLGCVPQGEQRTLHFGPVRVGYRDGQRPATLRTNWPALRVHTRVTASDLQRPFFQVAPPRAAPAEYRLPPEATGYTLLGLAALLALGGAALIARLGLRRRQWLPRLGGVPALEQILDELAAASANGDSGHRRKALEHLARELEPLDESLSVESRVLAWAPQDPGPETIAELTARVLRAVRR